MKLRCNDGELAIIIKDYPGCERNIGRVVTVRGPFKLQTEDGPTWLIYPECPEPWTYLSFYSDHIVTRPITATNIVQHPDAWLLPLRPENESKRIDHAETGDSSSKKSVFTGRDEHADYAVADETL